MSTKALIFAGVMLWAAWLIWHGRLNSPRRRREQARIEFLFAQARRERLAQPPTSPTTPDPEPLHFDPPTFDYVKHH